MYQVSYTTRHATGEPNQIWAEGIYLQDHFEIWETLGEAKDVLKAIFNDDKLWLKVHCWNISKVIEGSEPQWLEDCDDE
jgi:hypothetical protein